MTAPLTREERFTHFDQAIDAGMTGHQASRWVAYLDMKRTKGEQPIALAAAVAQLRLAAREHRTALAAIHDAASAAYEPGGQA